MIKQLLDLNVESVNQLIDKLEKSNLGEKDKEVIRQMNALLAGSLQ